MNKILVPILPNSPTKEPVSSGNLAEISLWENKKIGFTENRAFDPEQITYDENYQNFQGLSAAFEDHMAGMAEIIDRHYPKSSKIIEVGCGKGDFLKLLWSKNYQNILGYDATYDGDWDKIEKRYLTANDKEIKANVVILRHTLEHIKDPFAFLEMIKNITSVDSHILIEVPCFDWIRENQTFFDITYEHVNYFNLESLSELFDNQYIEKGHVFNNQYIFVLARLKDLSEKFGQIYREDKEWKQLRFEELFPELEYQFETLSNSIGNRPAYIWGAATKGCLFMHHLRRYDDKFYGQFKGAIDINPKKTNKFLPGTAIPIIGSEEYQKNTSNDDVILVSNPNYYDEICNQVKKINPNVACLQI
jgi:Methyltransferase domain/C-methyltransferase C-terminal domain